MAKRLRGQRKTAGGTTPESSKKRRIEQYVHKGEIDEDLIAAYCATLSLPFTPGRNNRVAVKIVDDRGIESLRIVGLESVGGPAL